jgi:hypothetical protein
MDSKNLQREEIDSKNELYKERRWASVEKSGLVQIGDMLHACGLIGSEELPKDSTCLEV